MPTDDYLPSVLREFRQLKGLADKALAQLPPGRFFTVPGDGDNSMAVIVKHVTGNLRSRWTDFLTSDGEKPGRKRDSEFVLGSDDTRENLLARWKEGWSLLFLALEPLGPSDLARTVKIRGEPLTVLVAINRQLTHYAYHVGQIVFLAKHLTGAKWASLSIPLGKSEQFNAAPKKYVETR